MELACLLRTLLLFEYIVCYNPSVASSHVGYDPGLFGLESNQFTQFLQQD